jgi:GNAT superfamily N-acetyltransferase
MWRLAKLEDDDAVVEMCMRLYDVDPGHLTVHPENMRATLQALRREPCRGRAVVLEIENQPSGYALLIAFWSNELGGHICEVDEVFVVPGHRSQGHGKSLFEAISRATCGPLRSPASCSVSHLTISAPDDSMNVSASERLVSRWCAVFRRMNRAAHSYTFRSPGFSLGEDCVFSD